MQDAKLAVFHTSLQGPEVFPLFTCDQEIESSITQFTVTHALDNEMENLDKQLVFYVNVVGITVFVLIMCYFFITTKPKDAVD